MKYSFFKKVVIFRQLVQKYLIYPHSGVKGRSELVWRNRVTETLLNATGRIYSQTMNEKL